MSNGSKIYLCKFENSMEHDLFYDDKLGKIALDLMIQKSLNVKFNDIKEKISQLKLSYYIYFKTEFEENNNNH